MGIGVLVGVLVGVASLARSSRNRLSKYPSLVTPATYTDVMVTFMERVPAGTVPEAVSSWNIWLVPATGLTLMLPRTAPALLRNSALTDALSPWLLHPPNCA